MLTQTQISQAKGTTGAPGMQPTQAMTPEAAHAWISGGSTQTEQPQEPQEPGIGSRVSSDLQNRGENLHKTLTSNENPAVKGLDVVGQGAGFAGDIISEGAKSIISKLPNAKGESGALANDPLVKMGAHALQVGGSMWDSFKGAHPEVAKILGDVGNIASIFPVGGGVKAGVEGAVEAVPKVIKTGEKAVTDVKNAIKPSAGSPEAIAKTNAARVASKADLQAKVKTAADAWAKPMTVNNNSFNGARAVLEKDSTIPQFLAENKVNPWQHIDKDGKIDTADTAQALRDTAAKMSKETLRPSLQMADYSVPKTATKEIKIPDELIQAQGKGVTPDDMEKIQSTIQTKLSALQRKYPDGMSLENMHDERISYSQNGKFSPVGDAGVDNNAIANRSLASVLGKLVETKAPEGVPVKEFQEYLQKFYRSADYLDSLQNKKYPQSLGQIVAHRAAQVGGAVVGHGIGGGVLGGVGGYLIGGALEHAIEHLSTSARGAFLKNLETTNPKAFTTVQDYLKKQGTGASGMLSLPAANEGTPIPLGTSKPRDSVRSIPATKAPLPVANPKTGKMTRVYTSQ